MTLGSGTVTTEQFIADLERSVKKVLRDNNKRRLASDRVRKAHSLSPSKSSDMDSRSEHGSSAVDTSSLASSSMSSSKEVRSTRTSKFLPPVAHRKKSGLAPAKQKIYDKLLDSPFLSTQGKEQGALEQIMEPGGLALPTSPVKQHQKKSRADTEYLSEFQLKLSATDALAGRKQGSSAKYMQPKKEVGVVSEAQGPISFSHDGIRSKHRGEIEREEAWKANQRMLQLGKFALGEMVPTPVIDRHPIIQMLLECTTLENSRAKQRSAEDNSRVQYSYDLHELWLTNVEHLKEHQRLEGDETESSDGGLEGRRDHRALTNMQSQIQSVSVKRAMQGAFYARAQAAPQLEDVPNFVPAPRNSGHVGEREPSLSMQVCGVPLPADDDSAGSIPGASHVGRPGLWWRYKWDEERTQACGLFYRALSGASFESVHIRINLALDTPWLIESVNAVVDSPHRPPKSVHQLVDVAPSTTAPPMCPALAKLQNEVCGRLSPPITILEEMAESAVDFIALKDASPLSQLVRHLPEFTEHGFRQRTLVHTLGVNFELESIVFGISKQSATANVPAVIPRNVWVDSIGELNELTRRRTPRDFKPMLVNTEHHGANEPIRFTIQMRNSQFFRAVMSTYASYEQQCAQIKELRDFQAKQAALDEKIAQADMILKQRKWTDEANSRRQQQAEVDRKVAKSTTTNRGWSKRMRDSDVVQVQGDWEKRQCRSSKVVFYRCATAGDKATQQENNFEPVETPKGEDYSQTCQWNAPAVWKLIDNSGENVASAADHTAHLQQAQGLSSSFPNAPQAAASEHMDSQSTPQPSPQSSIEILTQALLKDDKLISALAQKLGLKLQDATLGSDGSVPLAPRVSRDDASDFSYDSGDELWSDSDDEAGDIEDYMDIIGPTPGNYREVRELIRERNRKRLEQATQELCPVPMLILDKVHEERADQFQQDESILKWKRLPRPDLPKNFHQACVKTRTLGPMRTDKNQPNKIVFVGLLDPVDACDYGLEGFEIPLETLFIPDARKDYERVVTAMEKHIMREQRLAEAEIRTGELLAGGAAITDKTTREQFLEKQRREEVSAADSESRAAESAIAAAKHLDMVQLEDALACDIPIDTTDERGNTLFMIACQQGSKQLAKFLLRRGANINAQNIQRNTALHFCFTFGHIALAQYLVSKGADERLVNIFNMTCYEGTEPVRLADV